MADDAAPFPYLRWAKAHLDKSDRRSLGLSGRERPTAAEVPGLGPLALEGGPDAWTAWREAVARHEGLPGPSWVLPALGTSHGNFAAYLAHARGGRVLVERPAYGSLTGAAAAIGATCVPFRREEARDWRLDAAGLEAAARDGVDLIAVTDLHNPSGARLHPEDLDLLLDLAERHDAVVLVDEVYRELDPLDRPTAARRHPRVLVTNSLTKCYGLWDLRAGWIAGDPSLLAPIDAWQDLVVPVPPPAPLLVAAAFLPQSRPHLEATRARAAEGAARVDAWIASREDVCWRRPDAGFTGLVRTPGIDGDAVAARAWEDERVRVVPGSFFDEKEAIRVSFLGAPDDLEASLAGLGRALGACA